jgi:hypothetical protein
MGTNVPFDLCSICADWSRILPLIGKPKELLRVHKKNPIRGVSVTEKDYCQHLQFELNKVYPDGRKVCMINMHPKFFDISHVYIGADKTSKVLAKLAGQELCPIKDNSPMCKKGCYSCAIPSSHVHEVWSRGSQSIEKTAGEFSEFGVGGFEVGGDNDKLASLFGANKNAALDIDKKAEIIKRVRSNFAKALPEMESNEPDIPEDLQTFLADDLPDSLASAGSMGIVAKPKEFQRMVLIAKGRPRLADDLQSQGICFKPGAPPSSDPLIGPIIARLIEMLSPLIGDRSAMAPAVHRRIIKVTVARPVDRPDTVPKELKGNEVLDKISSDYSAYRRQLLYKSASLINQLVHEYPHVLMSLFGTLPEEALAGGIVKAGGNVVESIIGMFPVDYINKAYVDQPVSGYVDEHCNLEGLLAAEKLASCGRVA